MSKFDSKTLCVLSAGFVLAAAPLLSARAANRCDMPQVGLDARACAVAVQGSTELRRFIERTRSIYNLYYWDYARREKDALATEPASSPPKMATSLSSYNRGATSP